MISVARLKSDPSDTSLTENISDRVGGKTSEGEKTIVWELGREGILLVDGETKLQP